MLWRARDRTFYPTLPTGLLSKGRSLVLPTCRSWRTVAMLRENERTLLHPLIQRLNESRIYPHVTPRAYRASVPTGFLIGRCSSRAAVMEKLESLLGRFADGSFPGFVQPGHCGASPAFPRLPGVTAQLNRKHACPTSAFGGDQPQKLELLQRVERLQRR